MFCLLIYGCVVYASDYLVVCCHWHGGLPRLTMVFPSLLHFLNNDGVVGFPFYFMISAHVPYGCGLSY